MITQDLLNYINQQRQLGTTDENIKSALLANGWQVQDVNDALSGNTQQSTLSNQTAVGAVVGTNQGTYAGGVIDSQKNTGKATASLILGLIGLLAWIIPLRGFPITIIGLILGIKARKSVKSGVATAGIILCSITLVLTIASAAYGGYLAATGKHQLINELFDLNQSRTLDLPLPER